MLIVKRQMWSKAERKLEFKRARRRGPPGRSSWQGGEGGLSLLCPCHSLLQLRLSMLDIELPPALLSALPELPHALVVSSPRLAAFCRLVVVVPTALSRIQVLPAIWQTLQYTRLAATTRQKLAPALLALLSSAEVALVAYCEIALVAAPRAAADYFPTVHFRPPFIGGQHAAAPDTNWVSFPQHVHGAAESAKADLCLAEFPGSMAALQLHWVAV